MTKKQNSQKPKHLGSFWPLVSIFVVAALLGGLIIGVAYGNIIQDNIYSVNFGGHGTESRHAQTTPTSIKAAAEKTATK